LYNLYSHIANNPARCERLTCGDTLFTSYNCGLRNKFEDLWSHHNYIVYVIEGRKIWHTGHGSYDLREGSCVFVRKGASIVEQFIETEFCFFLFFIPDEFICDVLKRKSNPLGKSGRKYDPVMTIDNSATVQTFFQSMMLYFGASRKPDQSLLELKFRELILTIADNPENGELLSYFCSLLQEPQTVSLQKLMEDNFCFNLKMEEFAKITSRSLSAFKRDFERVYKTTPGKWLMEKRLNYAMHLLTNTGKTVSEAAFESGFESPSHFSRSFRQRFGHSPVAVRLRMAV
jgi:AraC family transcriptional regulator, exoenzyme S synthesis regulatory protein ExsA